MLSEFIAFAQVSHDQTLEGVLSRINYYIINPAIMLLFTIATVVFIWGIIKYIRNAADPKKRKEGQDHMLWGIIGFTIMVGVYGIITIITQFFGFSNVTVTPTKIKVTPQNIPSVKIKSFNLPTK
ncbi:MAG: hypothetical protein WCQ32_01570 [bacterium]